MLSLDATVVFVTPVVFATAAALGARARLGIARAADPAFLLFVAALAVIVGAAEHHGLGTLVDALVPGGDSPAALLCIAVLAAVVANPVNNLPAPCCCRSSRRRAPAPCSRPRSASTSGPT